MTDGINLDDWPGLLLTFGVGLLLGIFYLYGLWLTVQGISQDRLTGLWLPVSYIVRLLVLLAGFYLVLGDGQWPQLLAALAGFLVLRIVATRFVQKRIQATNRIRETGS